MTTEQALQRIEQPPAVALDATGRKAAIDDLMNKVALVMECMDRVMKPGEHYGKIPGCGDKPALLKAGAEKLGMTFRLRPEFDVSERDLGRGHREYFVKCTLSDGTQGVGSCNTMEAKYRFRTAERVCPNCSKPTIRTSKKDDKHPNGGFYCWAKIGGCGLQFEENDERITRQPLGKVEHDNPADYFNTCLKMGKKRAHVDAILTATAASDIFTQDVEEMVEQAGGSSGAPIQPKREPEPGVDFKITNQPQTQKSAESVQPQGELTSIGQIVSVVERHSKPDAPKKWTAFFIRFKTEAGESEAATFDTKIADLAHTLSNTQEMAKITTAPGRKPGTRELLKLEPAEQPPPAQADNQDDVPMAFDSNGQPIPERTTP